MIKSEPSANFELEPKAPLLIYNGKEKGNGMEIALQIKSEDFILLYTENSEIHNAIGKFINAKGWLPYNGKLLISNK